MLSFPKANVLAHEHGFLSLVLIHYLNTNALRSVRSITEHLTADGSDLVASNSANTNSC